MSCVCGVRRARYFCECAFSHCPHVVRQIDGLVGNGIRRRGIVANAEQTQCRICGGDATATSITYLFPSYGCAYQWALPHRPKLLFVSTALTITLKTYIISLLNHLNYLCICAFKWINTSHPLKLFTFQCVIILFRNTFPLSDWYWQIA